MIFDYIYIYIYIYAFSRHFYPKRLTQRLIQDIQYFFCQCCAMKWLLTLNSQQQFKLNRKKKSEHMEVGEDRKIVGLYRILKLHFGQSIII